MATQNHPQHHQMMSTSASGESYFGIEELGSKSMTEDHDVPLTWRGDPSETMSDWTIVIVTNELQTITYHVHKSVLCYGPRQSRVYVQAHFKSSVIIIVVISERATVRRVRQRSNSINETPTMFPSPGFYIRTV
jgi:hypothetical protein